MNFDITRQGLLQTTLWFVVMFALFQFAQTTDYDVQNTASQLPVAQIICDVFSYDPILNIVAIFVVTIINAFFITKIAIRNVVFTEQIYLSIIIYLIVALGVVMNGQFIIPLAASYMLITSVSVMIKTYRSNASVGEYFNAAALVALSAIIYAPTIFFILVVWTALIVFNRSKVDFAVSVVGFILPIFICSYIYWALSNDFLYYPKQIVNQIIQPAYSSTVIDYKNIWIIVLTLTMTSALVLSIVKFTTKASAMRKRPKKSFAIFLLFLIVALAIVALPCRSYQMIPIIAIPVSVMTTYFFAKTNSAVSNIMCIIIIMATIAVNLSKLL